MKHYLSIILLLLSFAAGAQVKIAADGSMQSTGSYPVTYQRSLKGYVISVKGLAERNAIPSNFRDTGMIILVRDSSYLYSLVGGIANNNWQLYSAASGISGGDTTIFNPVIDSTGQSAYRVLYGRGNNHIGSDPLFLYDSVHNKLVINAANFSIGGNNTKLYVNGNSTIGGNLLNNGNTTIRGTATISTTATGAAGTDSVLVQNNGLVKKIAGNSYISPSDTAAMLSTYLRTNIAAATYRTQAQVRTDISLTTTGTSGAATYNNSTGVFNIPQYSGGSSGLNNVYAPLIKSGDTISRRYNILHYGADTAKRFYDFVTTNLSTTVTSATANFVAGDVGKTILINTAGSGGNVLRTTIATFVNSTTITVTLAASATTSGDTTIYGKDNTVPLQNAVNACANGGGGSVFAPVGTYLFSSALIAASNAQITIPVGSTNRLVTIYIEGEAVSGGAAGGFAVGFPGYLQTNGTIFYSTISGSGYMPCFIGSADTTTQNGNTLNVSNLNLTMYTNHGASAISMTPINGRKFTKIDVEKNTIVGDIELGRSTSPASSEVAGIIAGAINNNGENIISENVIAGFKYAIVTSEHTTLNGNMIYGNINGIAIPFSYHPISGNSQIFACVNEVYSPTTAIFGMTAGTANVNLLIAAEWDTSAATVGTQWYRSVWDVADSAAHLTGAIRINMIGNSALINNNIAPHTFGINTQVLSVSNFANTYTFNNLSDTFYIPSTNQFLTLRSTTNTFQNGFTWRTGLIDKFQLGSNKSGGTTSLDVNDVTNGKVKLRFDTTGRVNIGVDATSNSLTAISMQGTGVTTFNYNVGLNTTTPTTISTATGVAGTILNLNHASQISRVAIQGSGGAAVDLVDVGATSGQRVSDIDNAAGKTLFRVLNDALSSITFNPITFVHSTGFVGINQTSPTSNLTVTGSLGVAYIAKTGTYTATASDHTINCTANSFTVTLPTAVSITGRQYTIVNSGSGTITIGTTSSQTFTNINATPTTLTMGAVGAAAITSYTVESDGANWIVTGKVKNE